MLSIPSTAEPLIVNGIDAISVQGRTHQVDNTLSFSWPGIILHSHIQAPKGLKNLHIDLSGSGFYQLNIYSAQPNLNKLLEQRLATQGAKKTYTVKTELASGNYLIELAKIGENTAGHLTFYGFKAPRDVLFSRPHQSTKKRIQFFTDSHGVGYGNESSTRECTEHELVSQTNHLKAYPQITAQLLTQQGIATESYSQSYSGIGIIRNWGGQHRHYNASTYKDSILLDQPDIQWDYNQDHADIIVIELGNNDFSTPLNSVTSNEPWKNQKELENDWLISAKRMIRDLQGKYQQENHPVPVIVMATYLSQGDRFRAMAKQLVSELHTEMPIANLDYSSAVPAKTGCHWHPNSAEHQAIAKLLSARIQHWLKKS